MTHDLYPERWRYCYPGNNASCLAERIGFGMGFVLYFVFVFGTLVTILGNSVVIVSVCHFRQLHNPTNVLILSLALADFLVGVIVMPFRAIKTVDGCWYLGDTFCQLHITFDVFLTTLSVLHLICIAVDRQQAICNPLQYFRKITMSMAVIMLFVIWTVAAVFAFGVIQTKVHQTGLEEFSCLGGCYSYFNEQFAILWSVLAFFFPCIVMVCIYTQIFIVAQQHVRKIGDMNSCSTERGRDGLVKQSENKAAKTLSIVLGAFIFCWTPFYLHFLFIFSTSLLVGDTLLWLGYFNSALNPIIYALFYPCFRKCFHCIITLKIFSPNSSSMNVSVK